MEDSVRDWSNGVVKESLVTYNFLTGCNIPKRLKLLTGIKWEANMHDMLKRIPSFAIENLFEYLQSAN